MSNDEIKSAAFLSQTLLIFHIHYLTWRREEFSAPPCCETVLRSLQSGSSSTELQPLFTLVWEQLWESGEEAASAIWQHIFGKCLIIASGERGWLSVTVNWCKAFVTEERVWEWHRDRMKQIAAEQGRAACSEGGEQTTEREEIQRRDAPTNHDSPIMVSVREEETFPGCWTKTPAVQVFPIRRIHSLLFDFMDEYEPSLRCSDIWDLSNICKMFFTSFSSYFVYSHDSEEYH